MLLQDNGQEEYDEEEEEDIDKLVSFHKRSMASSSSSLHSKVDAVLSCLFAEKQIVFFRPEFLI